MKGAIDYHVYAPLTGFSWDEEDFLFEPGLEIRRLREPPELRGLDDYLDSEEQRIVRSARHWLCFDWNGVSTPAAAETANLTLMSLWLAKPTQTHIAVRFEVVADPENPYNGQRFRLLDRFNWIPGHSEQRVGRADLERAAACFPVLREIRMAEGRLHSALLLSWAGCIASRWQVGLICFSAALEAMLTYSTQHGVTKRLAKTYACLVAEERTERDDIYKRFWRLYSIRSDIMHGRMHRLSSLDELATLADLGTLVRRLWRIVIKCQDLRHLLDTGCDDDRKERLLQHQKGYKPPDIQRVVNGNGG